MKMLHLRSDPLPPAPTEPCPPPPAPGAAPGEAGDLLPKALGRRIQRGLRLITVEVQELANDLRRGLDQYERELVISALEVSRRQRSRAPKANVHTLPDRLSRRIRRLQLSADAVHEQMGTLIGELKQRLQAYERRHGSPGDESALGLKARLEEYERELVASALEACGMNQVLAARQLGVLPTTLSEKMKRLGLRGPGRRAFGA